MYGRGKTNFKKNVLEAGEGDCTNGLTVLFWRREDEDEDLTKICNMYLLVHFLNFLVDEQEGHSHEFFGFFVRLTQV